MEILIKIIIFVFVEGFIAMECLLPINDRPTSNTQWIVFGVVSVLFFMWMFNFLPHSDVILNWSIPGKFNP